MTACWLIIDFDSTFVTVESLELLAEIALKDMPSLREREKTVAAIRQLTDAAMAGRLDFHESLSRRFELLQPRDDQIPGLIAALKHRISPSFLRHAGFLRRNAERIFIVSAGFDDVIAPVVADFGIARDHVIANRFLPKPDGTLGFDGENPLAWDGGKVTALRQLELEGRVVAVGDGASDLELATSGLCDVFFAYTETADRPEVWRRAQRVAATFDAVVDFLHEKEPIS